PPMRRSTIAVCLLLMSPFSVSACDDHAGQRPGWLEARHRSAWELAQGTAEGMRWEEMLGVASLAAGSAALFLGAVWPRGASRAGGHGRMHPLEPAAPAPRAVPWDQPVGLPVRVDQGHERSEPSRVTREDAGGPCSVAVAVAVR